MAVGASNMICSPALSIKMNFLCFRFCCCFVVVVYSNNQKKKITMLRNSNLKRWLNLESATPASFNLSRGEKRKSFSFRYFVGVGSLSLAYQHMASVNKQQNRSCLPPAPCVTYFVRVLMKHKLSEHNNNNNNKTIHPLKTAAFLSGAK